LLISLPFYAIVFNYAFWEEDVVMPNKYFEVGRCRRALPHRLKWCYV
jgi:hypothetical protein